MNDKIIKDDKHFFWTILTVTIIIILILIYQNTGVSYTGAILSGISLVLAGLFKWMADDDSDDSEDTSNHFWVLANVFISLSLVLALCFVWVWFILILVGIALFLGIKSYHSS